MINVCSCHFSYNIVTIAFLHQRSIVPLSEVTTTPVLTRPVRVAFPGERALARELAEQHGQTCAGLELPVEYGGGGHSPIKKRESEWEWNAAVMTAAADEGRRTLLGPAAASSQLPAAPEQLRS